MGRVGHGPPKILVGWATVHLAPPIRSLILGKIRRIGATIRQILRLKCTNSLSAAASPQTQGERCPPHGAPPNCIYGAYYQGDGGKVEGRRRGERKKSKGKRREKR